MRFLISQLPAFIVGALLVLIALFALGIFPTEMHYCYDQNTQNKECPSHYIAFVALWQINEILKWISPAVTAIATALIAYFTFTLKRSTDNLWNVTNRSLRHAEGTAIRELRAYVYLVISARIYPPPPEIPNRYAVSLSVINSGKSWARNVRIRMREVYDPGELDPFDAANLEGQNTTPLVLGHGESLDLQFHDVRLSELPALHSGERQLFFAAWATYEDALSDPPIVRHTQLSRKLGADTEGIGHVSFGWLPTHNCVDDDCPEAP